jgi:hypothetical protein
LSGYEAFLNDKSTPFAVRALTRNINNPSYDRLGNRFDFTHHLGTWDILGHFDGRKPRHNASRSRAIVALGKTLGRLEGKYRY